MAFKKAKREQIWIKVLLAGPSGSGKTYSALRLATGIAKRTGSRIAAIDTESGRIRYYANEFDFDDMQLTEPFTPERYNQAIDDAIEAGYKILIIDSTTHEWKGKGGCIEIHDAIPGNTYTAWGKVKPRHQTFVDKLIQSPIHLISTVRGKDEYVLEDKNGKQVPKKVGMGIETQDDAEYNYTVTFNLDQQSHVAEVMKDNTHLFEGKYQVLTEKDGEALYDWANSGEVPESKPATQSTPTVETPEDELKTIKKEILTICSAKSDTPEHRTAVINEIKKLHKSGNPNGIKDIETAKKVLEAVKSLNFEAEVK
jgi:GTPase SAR1 family protein